MSEENKKLPEEMLEEPLEEPAEEPRGEESGEHHHSHHHHHHSGKHSKHRRKSKRRRTKSSLKNKTNLIVNIVVILVAILLVLAIWLLEVPAPGKHDHTPDSTQNEGTDTQITTSTMQLEIPYFSNEVCLIHSSARAFANASVELPVTQIADQYKKTDTRLDAGLPVTISFRVTGIPVGCTVAKTTVDVSEHADFSQAQTFSLGADESSVDVYFLKTGTQYHYRITVILSDKTETTVLGKFQTADTVRILGIDGIVNVRDLGGWKTTDNRTVRQGLLFRGSELDGAVNPAYKLTTKGLNELLTVLGVRTDLDLRGEDEIPQASSVLGANVRLLNRPIAMYENVFNSAHKEPLRRIFADLSDPQNYPVYLHCTYGVDRTGTVCYLLGAVLGMSEQDLLRDYRLSALYHEAIQEEQMNLFLETLNRLPGETVQEKAENYLLSIGVTLDELASIKEIFLK